MTSEPTEEVAAVDLGSNSFHMIVARTGKGPLAIIDRVREHVRLGAGLDPNKNLTPAAMDRALSSLERFGQRLHELPKDRVRAVGTNTLRQAKNGSSFLKNACESLGHAIEIISGREEARLIYLGVAQTNPSDWGQRLVVDIGGGSTECIIGTGFDIVERESLFMGCVSFSQRFFPEGQLTKKNFERARLAAEVELGPVIERYRALGWQHAIGCSGTMNAIHKILGANQWSEQGLTLKGIRKLRAALIAGKQAQDLDIAGLATERKPVIAGGVAILEAIFESLSVEHMVPSQGALREGLVYDLLGRIRHEDVRDRTIRWFTKTHGVDEAQARRVEQTALGCLHHVKKDWGLEHPSVARMLSWAARLHEVGLSIAHAGYHKHSAYIVEHSDMAGFSQDAQRLLATVIVAHRRKPKAEILKAFGPDALEIKLGVLLRIAFYLNRSRSRSPLPKFTLRFFESCLALSLPATWLKEHPLTRADLEQQSEWLSHLGITFTLKSHQNRNAQV